ncbi:hypothetical protein KC360_g8660 [Hortaea werneckii]|nr:hypothetical protein KC325_g8646 [Hortaea werneckii]KAI6985323.1 hypothetical protein KC359_g9177 [Hortaea werneckii]KAI7140658.1 hypothetical protein KC344_g8550 [Hortaea werneckii]KAI7167417.1 hypothetical protein KC360_g8660 [Hortaea werneckii]
MDRLNSPAYGPAPQQTRSSNQDITEERQSFDSQRLRLRKKRSYNNNAGVRNASQPLPASPWPQNINTRDSGNDERARRGTLRSVVRRIFGRRSKEFDSQTPLHASPPRHGYHRSEPPALSIPKPTDNSASVGDGTFPHRTLSAPIHHALPQPNLERQRSPYAVEFPHSARLKPLNLANPFTAPGSQLRRRKTLPSLFIPENEAPPQTANDARASPDRSEQEPISPVRRGSGTQTTTPRTSKRKSRSVGDLKFFQRTAAPTPEERTSPRKRREDLHIWRDSIHGYKNDHVLRASGFTSAMLPPPPVEVEGGQSGEEENGVDRAPTPTIADPFPARASPGRAAMAVGDGIVGSRQLGTMASAGVVGLEEGSEEISHDLEDRVARLEAGLQHFQFSLRSLTNDRSRGTVVSSGQSGTPSSTRRRGGVRGVDYVRTPSMLADTLAADFLASPPHHHHHYHQHQQQQPGSSVYEEEDDHFHRVPSSSPLNYYYHHRPSIHDHHRPETPQTPPLRGSGSDSHHPGNVPGARPSMPPFPRSASTTTTMTEDEHDDDDDGEGKEENFPFPAQAASFSASAADAGTGVAVDSPGEQPSGPEMWTSSSGSSRKRRKESAGFHFPFPPSFQQRGWSGEEKEGQEEEEVEKERLPYLRYDQHPQEQERHRQIPLSQAQELNPVLFPPDPSPLPQQQQQQQHQHTFKSLYEMLADERSARRNLERQLQGLRREIRDLHVQVSSPSPSSEAAPSPASLDLDRSQKRALAWDRETSHRGRRGREESGNANPGGHSLMVVSKGGGGGGDGNGPSASHSRDFPPQNLRTAFPSNGPRADADAGGRGGGAPQPQPQGMGHAGHTVSFSDPSYHHHDGGSGKGVISRFSGSESEAGGGGGGGGAQTSSMKRYEEQQQPELETDEDDEELVTPLEAYQTPSEEAGRFGFI